MNRLIEHTGPARLGKRTKELVRRLGSNDIAIIDHTDIDRVSAEELVESGVRVVVNVSPSQSGRYPNPGPLLLVRGGVRLIDVTDAELFDELSDGERLTVRGASLFRNGTCLATGRTLDEHELAAMRSLEQQGRVTEALQDFADNTLRYLREEGRLLTRGDRLPAAPDRLPRPACPRRRARPGPQARPPDRAPVRARLPARAGRGRRRRRGAAGGGLEAGRDRRRHGLGHGRDAPLRRRDPRPRLPRGPRARGGAPAAARRPVPDGRRARDLGGHRDAARPRARRGADRRRRHALQPGRVPRAEPCRHVVDVRDAAEGGGDPDRRQGRLAARQPADRGLAARCLRPRRARRARRRGRSRRRRCGTSSASRLGPCSTFATTSPRWRRCS